MTWFSAIGLIEWNQVIDQIAFLSGASEEEFTFSLFQVVG